jgi:hypothetical protein
MSPQTTLAELPVGHLGFGAMRITGQGIWGPPKDESEAIALLRRVADRGVTFIDTADSYGPGRRLCHAGTRQKSRVPTGFAPDSPLEGSGFEPSVPREPTHVRMWISASKRPSLLTSSAIGR